MKKNKFDIEEWMRSALVSILYFTGISDKFVVDFGDKLMDIPLNFHLPIFYNKGDKKITNQLIRFLNKVSKKNKKQLNEISNLKLKLKDFLFQKLNAILNNEIEGEGMSLEEYSYYIAHKYFAYNYIPILPNEKPYIVFEPPYKHTLYNPTIFVQLNKKELFFPDPTFPMVYETDNYYIYDIPFSLYIAIFPRKFDHTSSLLKEIKEEEQKKEAIEEELIEELMAEGEENGN